MRARLSRATCSAVWAPDRTSAAMAATDRRSTGGFDGDHRRAGRDGLAFLGVDLADDTGGGAGHVALGLHGLDDGDDGALLDPVAGLDQHLPDAAAERRFHQLGAVGDDDFRRRGHIIGGAGQGLHPGELAPALPLGAASREVWKAPMLQALSARKRR